MRRSPHAIRDIRSYYGIICVVLMGLSMLGGFVHYSLQKPEYVARCRILLDDISKHHLLTDPDNTEWLHQELGALADGKVREHTLTLMDASDPQLHEVSWEILKPYGDIIFTVRAKDPMLCGEYLKNAIKVRRDIRRNERLAAAAVQGEALMDDMIVVAEEPSQYERARDAARKIAILCKKDPTGRSADRFLEAFAKKDPFAAEVLKGMFEGDTDMNYYRFGDVQELHYTREMWKSMVYGFWVGLGLIFLVLVPIDSLRKPVIPIAEESDPVEEPADDY